MNKKVKNTRYLDKLKKATTNNSPDEIVKVSYETKEQTNVKKEFRGVGSIEAKVSVNLSPEVIFAIKNIKRKQLELDQEIEDLIKLLIKERIEVKI